MLPTFISFGSAYAVTPNDTANSLTKTTSALYIGVTGDVKVQMEDGSTPVVFKAVPSGVVLYINVTQVFATGTTATNILGLL